MMSRSRHRDTVSLADRVVISLANTLGAGGSARKNIAAHYDLSNEVGRSVGVCDSRSAVCERARAWRVRISQFTGQQQTK